MPLVFLKSWRGDSLSNTANHLQLPITDNLSNQVESDSSEELEHAESANRPRAYLLVIGYILLYWVFVLLLADTVDVSLPLALPFVWVLLIYEAKNGKKPFSGVGLKREQFTKEIGIGIVVGVLCALVTLYSPLGGVLTRQVEDNMANSFVFGVSFVFPLNFLLEVFYIFAFLTPSEEILFRGSIQGKLQTRISKGKAIFVQSAIFGLLHVLVTLPFLPLIWSLIYGAFASIAAVTFGLIFAHRNGNLTACWIAHGVVNSISTFVILMLVAMG